MEEQRKRWLKEDLLPQLEQFVLNQSKIEESIESIKESVNEIKIDIALIKQHNQNYEETAGKDLKRLCTSLENIKTDRKESSENCKGCKDGLEEKISENRDFRMKMASAFGIIVLLLSWLLPWIYRYVASRGTTS